MNELSMCMKENITVSSIASSLKSITFGASGNEVNCYHLCLAIPKLI